MKVCVVCHERKSGYPVREDALIKGIRKIKQFLKVSTGNILVVCPSCYDEAKKRRQKFEKTLLTYAGIGVILAIIVIVLSLFSGRSLFGLIPSLLFLVFLVLIITALSLFQYFPAFGERKIKVKRKK